MALIKCRECGHMISDMAVACPKCGAPQTTSIRETQETDSTPTIYVQEEKKSNAWLYVVIALLVLAVGGLAYWTFSGGLFGSGENGEEVADTAMVKVSNFADKDYVYDGQWDPEGTHQPCRVKFTKSEGVLSNCSYTNLRYNATIALRGEIDGDSLRFLGKIEGKDLVIVLAPQPGKEDLLCGYGIDYKHEAKKKDMRLYLSDGKTLPPSDVDVPEDRYNPDRYVPDDDDEYKSFRYDPYGDSDSNSGGRYVPESERKSMTWTGASSESELRSKLIGTSWETTYDVLRYKVTFSNDAVEMCVTDLDGRYEFKEDKTYNGYKIMSKGANIVVGFGDEENSETYQIGFIGSRALFFANGHRLGELTFMGR